MARSSIAQVWTQSGLGNLLLKQRSWCIVLVPTDRANKHSCFFQSEGWRLFHGTHGSEIRSMLSLCRLFQRQSGQLQRPRWPGISWASARVPSWSLYCNFRCNFWELHSPTTDFRWRGGYDMIWCTWNFWRTFFAGAFRLYVEKIFPLCSRQLPIINIYSKVLVLWVVQLDEDCIKQKACLHK